MLYLLILPILFLVFAYILPKLKFINKRWAKNEIKVASFILFSASIIVCILVFTFMLGSAFYEAYVIDYSSFTFTDSLEIVAKIMSMIGSVSVGLIGYSIGKEKNNK